MPSLPSFWNLTINKHVLIIWNSLQNYLGKGAKAEKVPRTVYTQTLIFWSCPWKLWPGSLQSLSDARMHKSEPAGIKVSWSSRNQNQSSLNAKMAKSSGSAVLPKPSVLWEFRREGHTGSWAPHTAGQSSQGYLSLPAWRTPSTHFLQENSCFAFLPLAGCRADTRLAAGKVFARKDNFAKGSPSLKSISSSVSLMLLLHSRRPTVGCGFNLDGFLPSKAQVHFQFLKAQSKMTSYCEPKTRKNSLVNCDFTYHHHHVRSVIVTRGCGGVVMLRRMRCCHGAVHVVRHLEDREIQKGT